MITLLGELYSAKNSSFIAHNKKSGKPFVMKNKNSQRQMQEHRWQLKQQKLADEWKKDTEGKSYPLTLQFKIFRTTRRPFDYTNIIQGIADSLVKEAYLPDDNMNYLIPKFVPYELSPENPRVEITVE